MGYATFFSTGSTQAGTDKAPARSKRDAGGAHVHDAAGGDAGAEVRGGAPGGPALVQLEWFAAVAWNCAVDAGGGGVGSGVLVHSCS